MSDYKNILLGLMPFWDPLIPPNGIATLKTYLSQRGFNVKTFDLTTNPELLYFYNTYFNNLKKFIPFSNHGNFYNSGHDALERHFLAFLNCKDKKTMISIVETLIYKTYFYKLNIKQIEFLIDTIEKFYLKLEEVLNKVLDQFKPDVFGLTVYKNILGPSLFAYKLVRARFPETLNVFGGTIFADSHYKDSPNYEYLINRTKDYIDKVVIGPGEIIFEKILTNEFKEHERVINISDHEELQLDFIDIKIPDYSDFDLSKYPYVPVTGSKGCPFKCKFCNSTLFWGNFKKKETSLTVMDMKNIYDRYKNQLFFFTDAMINPFIQNLSEELIEKRLSLYYDGYFKMDKASGIINNTMKWRKSGFYRARIGIESGSQKILDLMNKKIRIEQMKLSLTALAHAGIKTTTYWVFGYPGETEADFQESLDFVEEMKDEIWQIEPAPFMYQYSGQVNSSEWESKRKLLYPEIYSDIMMNKTWELKSEPSREEAFKRTQRFIVHCNKLGIPNPYSIQELFKADQRWKSLHSNAVPSIVEFRNSTDLINENLNIQMAKSCQNKRIESEEFNFK